MEHVPVLLQETIEGLRLSLGSKVIDGTAGGGGHSSVIAERIGQLGELLAIDRDKDAVARVEARLAHVPCRHTVVQGNFRDIDSLARGVGFEAADAILLDLGMSSFQLEESRRGFSFQNDEPLLMTMDVGSTKSAAQLINMMSIEELEQIFKEYGEEPAARQIAESIVYARGVSAIATTGELVQAILDGVPAWRRKGRSHPATKVFQALRIAVNDELGALRDGLRASFDLLSCNGHLAVISFHSLEDRIVKQYFQEMVREGRGHLHHKKPIVAARAEILSNPRSRSAKLRIIEKVHAGINV